MPRTRDLQTAQHEAAHVVVGVALGLRVKRAALGERVHGRPSWVGYTLVTGHCRTSWALTLAAGIAWDQGVGDDTSAGDLAILRRLGYRGRAVDALARAAGALLETRGAAHARVTRALLERDLGAADIAAIARGERPDDE
jgi:hypothetical protein